jgi:hypothetical protein
MATFARRAHTTEGGRWKFKRPALRGLALAAVVALSLLAAACGGGSSGAKVAQIGTTNSAKDSRSSRDSGNGDARAYSACMRSHGVSNFPDPDSNGRIRITGGVDGSGQRIGVDMNTPQAKRAARACQKLQPNGGRPTAAQKAQMQQAMLKYARCMRSHGVTKFPDPQADGALVIGRNAGVDPNTRQFKAAQEACQKLVPGSPIARAPALPTKP